MVDSVAGKDESSRALGVVLALVWGFLYLAVSGMFLDGAGQWGLYVWRLFPIIQFAYIGPVMRFCWKRGMRKRMQGYLIGAAVAAMAFIPCWGSTWPSTS